MFRKIVITLLLVALGFGTTAAFGAIKSDVAVAENNFSGANYVYVTEYRTGKVVFAKNENERKPIASMVKIMTSLLTLEAIEKGEISLADQVEISDHAASMGGSQVFLKAGDSIKLSELLKSVVVASANDSAVAIAEHIGGSEDGFVAAMNQKAKELGLDNTNFVNATGLPEAGGYSSAKDVNTMTKELLRFPLYKNYCKIWLEDFKHPDGRTTVMTNTNKLVRFYRGCDCGKTGFTNEAMYCLSASAMRSGVRIVATVMGVQSSKERNAIVGGLFDLGFSKFECKTILKAQNSAADVSVSRGKQKTIKVGTKTDVEAVCERGVKDNFRIEYRLPSKLKAPINEGDEVGKLVVYQGDNKVNEFSVYALESVEKSNLLDEIRKITGEW